MIIAKDEYCIFCREYHPIGDERCVYYIEQKKENQEKKRYIEDLIVKYESLVKFSDDCMKNMKEHDNVIGEMNRKSEKKIFSDILEDLKKIKL